MPKKYTTLIGFGLIVTLTFGAGFKLGQHREVLTAYTQSNSRQQVDQKSSLSVTKSNQAAVILLMPKSYLPLLEKFRHRKIARAIQFVPAHIRWDEGQLVAISQKAILKNATVPDSPIVNISHRSRMEAKKENAAKAKRAQGVAFLYLLKNTARYNLRYAAQPSATAKAGL